MTFTLDFRATMPAVAQPIPAPLIIILYIKTKRVISPRARCDHTEQNILSHFIATKFDSFYPVVRPVNVYFHDPTSS